MDDVEEYDHEESAPSYPLNPWGPIVIAANLATNVLGAAQAATWAMYRDLLAAHNYHIDRRLERDKRRLLIDDLRSLEQDRRSS